MKAIRLLSLLFFCNIGISFAQSPCATVVGNNSIGGTGPLTGFVASNGATINGVVNAISYYNSGGAQNIVVGLYDGTYSTPSTLLVQSSPTAIGASQWVTISIPNTTVTGVAWIAVDASSTGAQYNGSGGNVAYLSYSYNGVLPSSLSGASQGSQNFSIFADVCAYPGPTPIPTLSPNLPFRRNQVAYPNNPFVPTGMLWMGDSWTAGTGSSSTANSFVGQATTVFAGPGWFPGLTSTNAGTSGIDSAAFASSVTTTVSTNYGNEPKTRWCLELGINNILHDVYQTAYTAGGENSFKADMTKIVNCMMFYYPNSVGTIQTMPDLSYAGGVTTGGLGANGLDPAQWPTYATGWVPAFNAALTQVANLYPNNIKISDVYTLMYGQPQYFSTSSVFHPSDAGHAAVGALVTQILRKEGGNR